MRTLGIDLAAEPKDTAACVIDWDTRHAHVEIKVDDPAAVRLMHQADRSAIDAPFGWPDAFREAINDWSEHGVWTQSHRPTLRLRVTDDSKRLAGTPLSVSADRIASVAFRCALLLARRFEGEPLDRVNGPIIEAYPAAALRRWVTAAAIKGYKSPDATQLRRGIVTQLRDHIGLTLDIEAFARTDHALDALVCALVARAAALNLTDADEEPSEQLLREGWIHLPQCELSALR